MCSAISTKISKSIKSGSSEEIKKCPVSFSRAEYRLSRKIFLVKSSFFPSPIKIVVHRFSFSKKEISQTSPSFALNFFF